MKYVFHMFYRPVCNASEVMQIISRVLKLRAHCPTLVHTDSSRSHLIVTLTISSKSPNALALGERHSYTHSQTHTRQHKWHLLATHSCIDTFITLSFSSQATECQEGHAALHPEGVVEPTLSPCQPCRLPLIWRALCKPRLLSLPLPFPIPMSLPQAQHLTGSVQDQAAAGGPGGERVCRWEGLNA